MHRTGWRLHAVMAENEETLSQLRGRRAACGLLPKYGWGLDLFVDRKCARCLAIVVDEDVSDGGLL